MVYESVKPGTGGSDSLMLPPMQLLDRLVALIPPLRAAVTALAQPAADAGVTATDPNAPAKTGGAATDAPEPPHRKAARYVWTLMLARICDQRKSL
ncbi:MAG: hypothetical protein IPP03_06705 [Dechloromonas sp.]|nr:hypothetical protein [Candidatus Dechloromonas phosphoritropha]